ncbi:chorismate mutase [Candidatus Daviesbacteria bacterium]|nr:chorismate mutase [Candidatus Daviesbacteria bacterium]
MNEITKLRAQIDKIDEELLDLIAGRVELVRQIGIEKKKDGIGVVDEDRERKILNELMLKAGEKGINPEIVKKVWKVLIDISYEIEGAKNGNS